MRRIASTAALLDASLNESGVSTHAGILHEQGHKEPRIIAMGEPPTKGRILDYGMRWSMEPMFSDCKSRGFDVTQTQLKHPDRIERLLLVLAVAMLFSRIYGHGRPTKTAGFKKKAARSLTSWFKKGIRFLLNAAMTAALIPKLWGFINSVRW